ncbi:hypothetical protein B6D08_05555 [Gilliamella apicola]|uniref:Uncharacterized protein n=2 Tax=Gilliamella apicola TaxID=1196095 RepID=A0A242NK21_9GAMM|nr:hypothetical protein B5S40_13365 [Gilliamella apicola]OTP82587.1 hypothetical protein B5S44_13440 [Gilliamella apicola]OTP86645.1 hypothetical protein B5S42_12915 [Gilliamella apicola]OTQ00154.1 hypothetical protein B6D08_05555 [Gilliamella apicola]OTQ07845.1 hypothetical protein B6C87_12535 [Gilliamella apicola]
MAFGLTGCSTKNYGRQGELTQYEKETMTCREIALEHAKVKGFIKHVEKESQFDGRSVLSFLGDFGVGNVIEKSEALKSTSRRLDQLNEAERLKNCRNDAATN